MSQKIGNTLLTLDPPSDKKEPSPVRLREQALNDFKIAFENLQEVYNNTKNTRDEKELVIINEDSHSCDRLGTITSMQVMYFPRDVKELYDSGGCCDTNSPDKRNRHVWNAGCWDRYYPCDEVHCNICDINQSDTLAEQLDDMSYYRGEEDESSDDDYYGLRNAYRRDHGGNS